METFPNLVTMFLTRAAAKVDAPFLWRKTGGQWQATSWAETARTVAALAASLRRIGLEAGDRVLLVAENRPEWCVADLAIMAAGGVTVPAYTTNTTRDHAHVLNDSGASMAILSGARLAQALLPAIDPARCRAVIAMEPITGAPDGVQVYDWTALVAGESDVAACAAGVARIGRRDLACLIYTSGTGGAPKGVMQHHGAILHNIAGCAAIIAEDFAAGGDEVFLSFLPLSHAYEHSAGQYLPIAMGAQIHYATGLDRLVAEIAEVRPTIMIVVPRLFEVLRARMMRAISGQGAVATWLLARTLALASRDRPRRGDRLLRALIRSTLARRVAARFGGRIKALVSGGAPLNPAVGRFFEVVGLTVLQGYGQTEAGPVISCNRPSAGIDMASVGPALPATELRIAADGEIMVRGENVTQGYWRDPQGTAQAVSDGWLATGDIGRLDAADRLHITDRKKDLIVNDKGDNVAPQRIEALLSAEPEIAQAMVVGDRRPYLVALLVADDEWRSSWAEARGLADNAMLRSNPALAAALQKAADRVSAKLAPAERLRRIAIADAPFTIDNGELTPSLKVRRHAVLAAYGARLDALYARQ